MTPQEYKKLAELEEFHWFYKGKRKIAFYWLSRLLKPKAQISLLDCGAGGGAFAFEASKKFKVKAMDDHADSLTLLKGKLPAGEVVAASISQIPFADESFDAITAMDIIEHVPNDEKALHEMVRVLKTKGVLFLTVPALMTLWSDWDESLGHKRRYTKERLILLARRLPLKIVHVTYFNFSLFPIIWFLRKIRGLGICKGVRAEDRVPVRPLNKIFEGLLTIEACSGLSWPFGVSILLAARKVG